MASKNPNAVSHTKRLCFVDVETTGTDEETDQIIEVAAAVLDLETDEIIQEYQNLVDFRGELPDFHKGGRFSLCDWGTAVHPSDAVMGLYPLLDGLTIAGQNPTFDIGFLKPMFVRSGAIWPADYHKVDTATIGHFLARLGIVEGVSLKYLRKWAGLPGEQTHTAMSDVHDSIEVYRKWMAWVRECADPAGLGLP